MKALHWGFAGGLLLCLAAWKHELLFPSESTSATIDAASRRGENIELEIVRHEGHTLVVGKVIPQAMRWILTREPRMQATRKPAASAPRTSPMNTGSPAPSESEASPSSGPRK